MKRVLKNSMRNRFVFGAALFGLAFALFAAAHPALAQTAASQLEEVGTAAGLPSTNIAIIIARVIRVFLGTLGIIFTIVVLYGGFLYLTAAGDPDKVKTANKMFKNAVIGLIICLSAFTITQFILSRLLDAAGLGGGSTSIADQYSEPLSGSLGAGIIDSHYPERFAIDIPRNTRVMVTFKEAIEPSSIISGYEASSASTDLNVDNVLIYPTEEGDSAALTASEVLVTMNESHTIFVFDPVDLLGNAVTDTNYTVLLGDGIQKESGAAAFTGVNSDGYAWTFEVSTEVDLTPPQVVSVIPSDGTADEARNATIAITFTEAMDPVAATGTYTEGASGNFRNLEVLDGEGNNVEGTFVISNGYKTLEFTPTDACGEDPCGDTIYCLPASDAIAVEAHAATLGTEPPQALAVGVTFDGLVDAAANSLDGNGNDEAEGPPTDDYLWDFTTSSEVNDTVPTIVDMSPNIEEELADQDATVDIEFSVAMRSSTLNTDNVSLWPDPWYEFWFSVAKTDVGTGDSAYTVASISHPTLVSTEDGGYLYSPVVTRGAKSNYQICMFPAVGPNASDTGTCDVSASRPYCCNGEPSASACSTSVSGVSLPNTEN